VRRQEILLSGQTGQLIFLDGEAFKNSSHNLDAENIGAYYYYSKTIQDVVLHSGFREKCNSPKAPILKFGRHRLVYSVSTHTVLFGLFYIVFSVIMDVGRRNEWNPHIYTSPPRGATPIMPGINSKIRKDVGQGNWFPTTMLFLSISVVVHYSLAAVIYFEGVSCPE